MVLRIMMKMMPIREGKQERSSTSDNNGNTSKATWSRFKQDPRIVRVSKALGGKDRHSKVCTVRGLRDRRVRLSVPTAIQLYDLQERLGLNQPSKVVDWLLDAAKHEIDGLPPLQIPQGAFINPLLTSDKQALNHHHQSWTAKSDDQEESSHELSLPQESPSSFTSLLSWDPSNLTLSGHPPRLSAQNHEDLHNLLPSPLLSAGIHHQLLLYQPPGISTTHPYFPSQTSPTNAEFDPKQRNFHRSTSSSTQPVRPIQFSSMSITADLLPSDDQSKHSDLHSS